jgi:hypothetical protein
LRDAGISGNTPRRVIERRLRSVLKELNEWVYRRIAARIRDIGAKPIFVMMPMIGDLPNNGDVEGVMSSMENYGFETINLMAVYDGRPPESVKQAAWDTHPNRLGHRLVAEKLFIELRKIDAI